MLAGKTYRLRILFLITAILIVSAIISIGQPSYTESVKITPLSVNSEGEPLPYEALWNLFDGDTGTVFHVNPETSRIVAALGGNFKIKTLRFFGKVSLKANVYWGSAGSWTPVDGLSNLDLDKFSDGWNSFDVGMDTVAEKLMIELVPLGAGTLETGVGEIEIWGESGKKSIADRDALITLANSGDMSQNVIVMQASPATGQISRMEVVSEGIFSFNSERDPRVYKETYLLYESSGLSNWIGTRQSINGKAFTAGFWVGGGSDWTAQIEPLNPLWLKRGANTITLSTPEEMYGEYSIRNVRIVALMDDGRSFVKELKGEGAINALTDENLSTPWAYSPASGGVDYVDIYFKHPVRPHTLSLHIKEEIKGKLDYKYLSSGEWTAPQGGETTSLNPFQNGWNDVKLNEPDEGTTTGIRLIFQSTGAAGGDIYELSLSGSTTGEKNPYRKLHVSSPEEGEYYGRKAYVSGWLDGPDASEAEIYIAGQKYTGVAKEPENFFGRAVSKEDAGFENQGDREPWKVEVKAVYPDGSKVTQTVNLKAYRDEVPLPQNLSSGVFSGEEEGEEEVKRMGGGGCGSCGSDSEDYEAEGWVYPGNGKKLGLKGAKLHIPQGAVWKKTKVKVQALGKNELPPLDPGMVNVTAPDFGYRFTPHGMKFRKKVKLDIPYDFYLLPGGIPEEEIWTFYYDEVAKHWKKLKRVHIDKGKGIIESETDHFTDMINAVLVTPEHPDALTYNPNTIKDIKAADPGAGINLIDPPKANNMGDARLSYPIEAPPGRKGMRPNLSVSYNSSGGNGWLGLGWDISVPAITIDTKWGAPRYDAGLETETYMLNGEMLTPVAHRGELKPRMGEKVFHTRVEGEFRKIIRHGYSPSNYWWEVIGKSGTRSFYGGNGDSQDAGSLLASQPGSSPVYKWVLREVRDTNGNTMTYSYDRVTDKGIAQGTVNGYQLYLKEITYTGHNGSAGLYSVKFVRDSQLPEYTRRPDVTIDARGGFKVVTAELLKKIEVRFNGATVRSYTLKYEEGAFKKTLLSAIEQSDKDGQFFNSHGFTYHDELNEDDTMYEGFNSPVNISTGDDGIRERIRGNVYASALGGVYKNKNGSHMYKGRGLLPTKPLSSGSKHGSSTTTSETYLALVDLNGDSLPDKVFRQGSSFYYRPNSLNANGLNVFGAKVPLPTLKGIGKETSTTIANGPEHHLFVITYTKHGVKTTSIKQEYFSDVNGDGLTDLVRNGTVWFNYLDENGVPTFTKDSSKTEVPVSQVAIDTEGLIADQSDFYEEQIDAFPLIDPVRRWTAPYSGTISITGSVTLLKDTSEEREKYETADGVRVTIQHNGSELWAKRIEADDYTAHAPDSGGTIPVSKGDRIYFRVQSVFDGAYDQVEWDPEITYVDKPHDKVDENNQAYYRYKASEDFIMTGAGDAALMPYKGKVRITGDFVKKGATTDDINVVIYKNDEPIISKIMTWDETGSIAFDDEVIINVAKIVEYDGGDFPDLDPDLKPTDPVEPVEIMDSLRFVVHTDSPIDLTRIEWSPKATYIEADEEKSGSLVDEEGNFIITIEIPYDTDRYPEDGLSHPRQSWNASKEGALIVSPQLELVTDDPEYQKPIGQELPSGQIVFTVKRRGELLGKNTLEIVKGEVVNPTLSSIFVPHVTENDELFFDFTTKNVALRELIITPSAEAFYVEPASWTAERGGLAEVKPEFDFHMRGNETVLGKVLFLALREGEILDKRFIRIMADKQTPFEVLPKEMTFNEGDEIDFYMIITDGNIAEHLTAASVSIVFEETSHTVELNAEAESLSAPAAFNTPIPLEDLFSAVYRGWVMAAYNGNRGRASNPLVEVDFILSDDENINAVDKAYPLFPFYDENHWGGQDGECWIKSSRMSSSRIGRNYIEVIRSDDFTSFQAVNKIGAGDDQSRGGSVSLVVLPISISGSKSDGHSSSTLDYMDMNGDRYPDIVSPGGIQYTTFEGGLEGSRRSVNGLNNIIRKSKNESMTFGLGAGGSVAKGGATALGAPDFVASMMVGLGLSASFGDGDSEAEYELMDMNGDGLPDKIHGAGGVRVALNLGYGFAQPEDWGVESIQASDQDTTSFGGGYNVFCYAFGGGINYSKTESEVYRALTDINGDSLPDYLYVKYVMTEEEGSGELEYKVRFNTGAGFDPPRDLKGYITPAISESYVYNKGTGHFKTKARPRFSPLGHLLYWKIYNPGKDSSKSMSRTETAFRDINGDGYADHLHSSRDRSLSAAVSRIGRTNLLKSVTRPLGSTFEMSYKRSGNTYDQPQSRWVMSRVELFDGHAGDGPDRQVTTWKYDNGKYDRYEREFYGYKTLIETQHDNPAGGSPYRTSTRTYLNDGYYTKGLLKSALLTDSLNQKYTQTVNSYLLYDTNTKAELNPLNGATATVFPKLKKTEKLFFEKQPEAGKRTYTTFVYDDWGNVTAFYDAGEPGAADDIYAGIVYDYREVDYLMSLPKRIAVEGSGGKTYRERKGTYDAKGNLTKLVSTIGGGKSSVSEMTHDAYGNILTFKGAANHAGKRYSLTYVYDRLVKSYVEEITDSFGYKSTASYDYRYGKPNSTTDLNGNVINYRYDSVGRTTEIYGPYDIDSDVPTIAFFYYPNESPARALTKNKEHWEGDETIDTLLYIDGLKRVLQTKKEAEVEKVHGATVSGKVVFDALGRSVQQGQPLFEAGGFQPDFTVQAQPKNPTLFAYDAIDRTLKVTLPDDSRITMSYGFEEGMFLTKVTDAEDKEKKTLKNVRDAIVAVKEKLGTGSVVTRYAYNPMTEIVKVTDDHDNMTAIAYDLLGRRTVINNPDTGEMAYRYDAAGNLVEKITPNLKAENRAIKYLYDYNRLIRIDYPNMADVEYSYGAPGAEFNRAGRIVKVENPDVRAERFYGKLGETVKEIKSFWSHSPPKAWREHTTEYEFDSFGRMRSLVYPDGEVLTYGYDKGGLVVSATGFKGGTEYPYLKDITYDEFGQRTQLELGNGVVTHYEYDDKTRRLGSILSSNEQGYTLQNMAYSYDLVGNILGTDNAPFMTFNDSPLSVTQTYGYDDLHRLKTAEGQYRTGADRVDRYLNAFEYDTIGNFTVKDQDHHDYRPSDGSKREKRETTYNFTYKYESSRPHAPTHIGDVTYNYDANGNMLGWNNDRNGQKRRIVWDEENRVESVTDGSTTRFLYDADGTRAMKRGRYGEVVYVNENYAVRNGEIHTKHVFAGNTRLATKLRLMRVQKGNVKTSSISGYTTTISASTEMTTTTSTTTPDKKQAKPAAETPLTTGVATSSVQETIRYSTVDGGTVKGKGQAKGKSKGGDTSLPGNSEKGLETALSHGQGTKKGIYRRLDLLGYEVTPEGDIVPAGTEPPPGGGGGGGTTPPGGGNGGGGTGGGGKGNDTFEEKAIFYFHADHLGSSTVLTDADGEVYEHMQYFPYGEMWVEETKSQIYFPYKFTGKELDPETGLYYFGARYYEPRISVWLSTDPILDQYIARTKKSSAKNSIYQPLTLSLFSYAGSNPVKYIDPDGQEITIRVDNVDTTKLKMHITAQVHGAGASEAFAQKYKSAVEGKLTGTFGMYEVETTVDVEYRSPGMDVDTSKHQLEVSATPGVSKAEVGGNEAWLDIGDTKNVLAHETGHLFGTGDEYIRTTDSSGRVTKTVPKLKKGNIMASTGGSARFLEKHIETMIGQYKKGRLNIGVTPKPLWHGDGMGPK